MSWFTTTLSSSVGKKLLMALTGFAFLGFLAAHLAGNLTIYGGREAFNGYAERLMRTIKEEEVNLSDYLDFTDAYHQIGRFLEDVYMHKRIHSSLGYLTPVEFENQWSDHRATGTTID